MLIVICFLIVFFVMFSCVVIFLCDKFLILCNKIIFWYWGDSLLNAIFRSLSFCWDFVKCFGVKFVCGCFGSFLRFVMVLNDIICVFWI